MSWRDGSNVEHTGLYERSILPHLINLAMKNKVATRYRRLVVPFAQGRVLEVGFGSGLNLPFYGPQVTHLLGLDPSPKLLELAGRRTLCSPFAIEFLQASAEAIPLAEASVDTVVSTFTLCSIPDVGRALREMRRVLKPGGCLLFAEHGQAPEAGVQRWQHRLTPLWRPLSGGCHLDRKIDRLIADAGFRLETLNTEYAKGPRLVAFMYRGVAARQA
jgi:ubiquinone/menaquinone biosynthesis C-methylase UbiE